MATAPHGSEAKPADILNEDIHSHQAEVALDPESDEDIPLEAEELKEALGRSPPVNSSYLPLPWKGRLGYACLNTYLRYATPAVFCSRTCRIASIIENRHPLQDPEQPAHSTKNRPDRDQPADVARGQAFVEALGLTNARDLVKILRWNDRYGIKFMRLSSEMFPFASHKEYGYKLAPFASEVLADAGRVVAELGHRVSVHPGQFTQFGSPRKEVIESSQRDLEYHSELLQLLKLPPQQDRDAVMILHMGGVFGDKAATLDRFRENYAKLSQDIKNRLVLENDDVSWSVHDLLPICEELNIPLVLDYHHHNIIFDSNELREGTQDIIGLYDRIAATWSRKNITQKMHYSEPTAPAITPRQRRKHSDRVNTLPPCADTMDLMIEAKDKEQAVFELMRNFKLPGYERVNDLIPFMRPDENQPFKPPKRSKKNGGFVDLEGSIPPPRTIPEEEVSMGGPDGRVYWPRGMEEWLRPAKKVVKPKAAASPKKSTPKKVKTEYIADDIPLDAAKVETPKKPNAAKRTTTSKARSKRKASVIESTPEPEETSDVSAELENSRESLSRRSSRAKKHHIAKLVEISEKPETNATLAPKPRFRWPSLRSRTPLSQRPPTLFPSFPREPRPSKLSRILRLLVGPHASRRAQSRLWGLRHETLPALRHRAQSRIYRAIVKRQARLAARDRRLGGGIVSYLLGPRRQFRTWRANAASSLNSAARHPKSILARSGPKEAAGDPMAQPGLSSTWGPGGADGAGVTGSRRKKVFEYFKAANELRQSYTSQWSGQRNDHDEDYYNTPGAFPDIEIARSGDEEMVLFPSYARKLTEKKKTDASTRPRRDSWSETIDEYRGEPHNDESSTPGWDDTETENAVVAVDVRGWIYAPGRGPMSRKHRLMIALARKLSGIPAPTGTTNDESDDKMSGKGDDEYVDKQMQNLVDTAEKEADPAWKSTHTDKAQHPVPLSKDELSMANAHLMERLRPFLTNPVASMPVTVFFFDENESKSRNITTDESGHFTLRAALPFVPTHIRVLASEDLSAARPIQIIDPVGISLISDIDDTVKHSAIAGGAKEMFRNTFVRELGELTVEGVSDWYGKLAKQGVQIHYVSNAPWQLYPLLERYFKMVGLPPGSFHLKQYSGMLQGIFEPTAERKRGSLEQILRDFPERKFILVGDSGEADLEVYTDIVLANPGRILGIFIRDVTTSEPQQFFEKSVGPLDPPKRNRSFPDVKDQSDAVPNRPALPPRASPSLPAVHIPSPDAEPQSVDIEDLIDLTDLIIDQKPPPAGLTHPDQPRPPPVKPVKPSALRMVSTPADLLRARPARPSALRQSTTPSDMTRETSPKPSPAPQEAPKRKPVPPVPPKRGSTPKTESLIDAEPSPISRSSTTGSSTNDASSSLLSNLNDGSSSSRSQSPPRGSKQQPPLPPPRRANGASPTAHSDSSGSSTPRPAASSIQSYPAAAAQAAYQGFQYATERLNLSQSPSNGSRQSPAGPNNESGMPPVPLPNKREELWRRRWERASEVLEDHGVVLGSWRVGTDAQPVCAWLVERAIKDMQAGPTKKE
ncbi:hypothetical protein PENARI_c004G08732 [Penicillium arizonense]|uniref:Phosphatidate phosphatase APP1 catalytic domain-containing protein n=1 Tax=Penicillium arizonense TaxID=1835702 RepID=A0A1F5LQC7_PENAI|nr:hypothetical protein PENARI_c004G08732 [Penicillium arizonense]OGE55325.1 hypothetical protein PENARI_c004G08732 [Penicillium arizonense]